MRPRCARAEAHAKDVCYSKRRRLQADLAVACLLRAHRGIAGFRMNAPLEAPSELDVVRTDCVARGRRKAAARTFDDREVVQEIASQLLLLSGDSR